jgi:histidinol-phosphate aminotransferase
LGEEVDEDLAALVRPELWELEAYAPAPSPAGLARLDANEAPAPTSNALREAVVSAMRAVALERYPDARASLLKARIAERTGAKPSELLVGTGSDEVISLLLTALARPRPRAPQPVVLIATPTFVMYKVTARAHGWKPVEVALDAEWDLDVKAMALAIELMRPNIVFIASPNNPTGNLMNEDRLREISVKAKGALVVIDEAYTDYARGDSLRGWRAEHPHIAILRTLSKIGLAALRVGWLEADEGLVREIDKARQPFNVSATSQAGAAAVLGEAWDEVQKLVAKVGSERDRVAGLIAKMPGFSPTPSHANFIWVRTPRPAKETHAALASRGVLVRSFHTLGGRMAHQLRITVGSPQDNDRMLEALGSCA